MQETLILTFRILSAGMVLVSIIPMIRNEYWMYRIVEFPRAQKWVLNVVLLIVYVLYIFPFEFWDGVFLGMLSVNLIYLSYQIYPYLPIARKQIQSIPADKKPAIRLMIFNVYQYNDHFEKLIYLVHKCDADVILLVETDAQWKEKCVAGFGDMYAFKILEDREDTYGMLLFSRLELKNTKLRYLIKDFVPSISTEIILEGGRAIKLYALHPAPPVPSESRYSTERDAEILMVGKEASEDTLPVIVAGDLNDVAWSYSTDLFLKISKLLDPRRGRGFYNTFHAKHFWARWPLDHVFCSGHFRVQKMERLPASGSDHFPIFIQLYLSRVEKDEEALEAKAEDIELAEEKIEKGKAGE
ncbi:MAG: endonuclease/exonuclease/phosphatase family protein [Saprospiraceae bacterium]|nr:endonuclease/exonuclease/phosphatase family protein [Saprospiraceae bacterium]